MTTKALGTYWTLPVTSLQNWYQKEFKHHKNCRTEKSKKVMKWPTLYSVITCWKRPNIKCQKGTYKGILSNACTVSSVTALSHPQKKQGQGKNSSQILSQYNSSVLREKGIYSRSYREHKKPEIRNATHPYPSRASAREGHWASEPSDPLFQEKVTEDSCLKHFVAISPASVLDSVTSGRAEECAAVCQHPGTTA